MTDKECVVALCWSSSLSEVYSCSNDHSIWRWSRTGKPLSKVRHENTNRMFTIFFFFLPERAGGRGEIFIHTVRLTHTLRICTHTHLHTCINQNFTLTNHCTQILYIYTHVCSLSLDTHLHVQGIEPQKRIHNTHTITI